MTGAKLFTAYLRATRDSGAQSTLAPGRFLLPGELEGSPLLTFFPMPLTSDERPPRGSLAAMMTRRFESYKSLVVKPFFNDHFARLDRQIVLVDVLTALHRGAAAVGDLERAMTDDPEGVPARRKFMAGDVSRHEDRSRAVRRDEGRSSSRIEPRPPRSHLKADRREAITRAETEGAGVHALALSALRATREATAKQDGEILPCLRGTPIKGERIGKRDLRWRHGSSDIPRRSSGRSSSCTERGATCRNLRRSNLFASPRPSLSDTLSDGKPAAFPHIRLDRALDFLISDYLA